MASAMLFHPILLFFAFIKAMISGTLEHSYRTFQMLKIFFFLIAFLTQKLAPSNDLNGIIFAIDEQCNLIFETALFINCKPYIIFLFSGAH